MANLTQAELQLKVWDGRFTTDIPADPTYTITKTPVGDDNNVRFEISELFKDYIEPTFSNNYLTISNAVWVYWTITKTFSDAPDQTETGYGLGVLGYGYFSEGINPNVRTGKQIDNEYVYLPEGRGLSIPIFFGTNGVKNVRLYGGGSLLSDTNHTIIDPVVDEYPIDLVGHFLVTDDVDYALITKNDLSTEIVYVEKVCEPKFTPYKISFINKYGAIQDLWFFKKRTDRVSFQRDEYSRNTIEVASDSTISYSVNKPTDVVLDVKANKKFTLNTGFVKEEYTETIQQLMLSENVWIVEGNQAYPIIPTNQELTYKTVLNDKVINFTVEFKYGFNEFNVIR